jgi:hydroxyacylglutathione hydrolase
MVITIPALSDNFIYLFCYGQSSAFAVDPGDGQAVLGVLKKHDLNLTHILTTHSHFDHTAGIKEITSKTGCEVVQNKDDEDIQIGELSVKTIPTPGHTRDSRCFYIPASGNQPGVLFTGDTLFTGGCGRPMGCDPAEMWESLCKIKALPDETLVYPGHNYTQENYEFALTIEPENETIRDYLQKIKETPNDTPGVPSSIAREKKSNIFFRADESAVKAAVNTPAALPDHVFTKLRKRKNIFG